MRKIAWLLGLILACATWGSLPGYGNVPPQTVIRGDSLVVDGFSLGQHRSDVSSSNVTWTDKSDALWLGKGKRGEYIYLYFDDDQRIETIYGSSLSTQDEVLIKFGTKPHSDLAKRLNVAPINTTFGSSRIVHYVLPNDQRASNVHLFLRIEKDLMQTIISQVVLSVKDNYP